MYTTVYENCSTMINDQSSERYEIDILFTVVKINKVTGQLNKNV